MSNITYDNAWKRATVHFEHLLSHENPLPVPPNTELDLSLVSSQASTLQAQLVPKDRDGAVQFLVAQYTKYLLLYRQLEKSYDLHVHPQKRRVIKDGLVAAIGRLMEVKAASSPISNKLSELECTDFLALNDVLLDLKLRPSDLAIPVPHFFTEDREGELTERSKMLEQLKAKVLDAEVQKPPVFPELSPEYAAKVIQRSERRRYRGYVARKEYKTMRYDEMVFLGMAPPLPTKHRDKSTQGSAAAEPKPTTTAERNRQRRKKIQRQHEDEYQAQLVAIKDKISKVESPDIRDQITDSFRAFVTSYRREFGKFPELPEEVRFMAPGFSFDEYAKDLAKAAKEAEGLPGSAGGKKSDGKKDAKKDGKGGRTAKRTQARAVNRDWRDRNDRDNLAQKCETDIIKRDKRGEVEVEVKRELIQVLKDELENLRSAAERDAGGKKGKGGKAKEKKKGKKEGKKGKKKEKDLTAVRDINDILAELVQEGICQCLPTYAPSKPSSRDGKSPSEDPGSEDPKRPMSTAEATGRPPTMDDFVGEIDIVATTATNRIIKPTLGELKRVITETCVLPLGLKLPQTPVDPNANEAPPPPPEIPTATSVMLYGPRVVQATGSLLFNLTPSNTAGHYSGKAGTTKMLHMVFKVDKVLAPAVVFIEGAEMVFAKKVPKDDTTEPNRIKKELFKYIKALEPSDRVLVIATSHKPWEGDLKTMQPYFAKYIQCPRPDYSSRRLLLRHFMAQRIAQVSKTSMAVAQGVVTGILARRGFNLSTLVKFMDCMSAGVIKSVVLRTLSERRVVMLQRMPLEVSEFTGPIGSLLPLVDQWRVEETMFKRLLSASGAGAEVEAAPPPKKKK
ncbi:hypothetical protein M427DRAFT_30474 [Gonapodya prolifera JEL478]|uniref:ATPase AAA-type core domain-containing protein n=1 Tax=Gonapodya prolifera (strain JEL478) TaxID=1344416 RepID=A0A139AKM7_GONPJ|nr:hypothetical protein M427DRAFT_30474 [Gonapodya prolifera JEL478]|eukprot:KXS17327.1 hypothetical protein M427DRAFT_30474 [Gonapodya prolifera JEL478]